MASNPLKYIGPWGPYFWFTDEWLSGRLAKRLFHLAAIIVLLWVAVFLLLRYGVRSRELDAFFSFLDVATVLAGLFLWFGMLRYWVRLDHSKLWIKRVSFLALLGGFWWGASLYCLVCYGPQVAKIESRAKS